MKTCRRGRRWVLLVGLLGFAIAVERDARAEWQPDPDDRLQVRAAAAVARFEQRMPRTERFFEEAYGYAVFPAIRRFGIGLGASWGPGLVIAQDRVVGTTKFRQFTSGIQAGVRVFSMIVFFKDEEALEYYKRGLWQFVGHSGVSFAKFGASGDPGYNSGVAIFTNTKTGLMLEAAISGARYPYRPLQSEQRARDEDAEEAERAFQE